MDIVFHSNGTLTSSCDGRSRIAASPVGLVAVGKKLFAPVSSDLEKNRLTLHYEMGDCVLSVEIGEWTILRIESVPEGITHFFFGPYLLPDAVSCGEMLGCGWMEDGSGVCIQSLNPKTVGEALYLLPEQLPLENGTSFPSPGSFAASLCDRGGVTLQCRVSDMSKPERGTVYGLKNVRIDPVEGEDGRIPGGAVALLFGKDPDDLLGQIGRLEVACGLPHPTINGEWAKTSPLTNEPYLVIETSMTDEEKVLAAERAGLHCVYFGDPFRSWGHFEINRDLYPGGEQAFGEFVSYAESHGVMTGFHTLSNFIHTHDPYVTPVPHRDLLIADETLLTADLSDSDREIPVADANNFSVRTTLNCCRIGDELIRFGAFDESGRVLLDCERGAYGTKAVAHKKGERLSRLTDHGYATLFPSIGLQGEMADRIGTLIRDSGVRRMSFDGLEGCTYTGRGEYASSEYVRRVFAKTGNEFLCDASNSSHYRWHCHSYFNWGEPWYEDDRKGGTFNYRAANQLKFRRNLFPGMLGWYCIWGSNPGAPRLEATTPEVLEAILSRTVGFDAGCCFVIQQNGRLNEYLDRIRVWGEFRASGKVTEELKAKMRDSRTDWHLEKTETGWEVSELMLLEQCLNNHQSLTMESGTTAYSIEGRTEGEQLLHRGALVVDSISPDPSTEPKTEPMHFRIRVGYPNEKGHLDALFLAGGWGGPRFLSFPVQADPGDYLEYHGGTCLEHYNAAFEHLETVRGEGEPAFVKNSIYTGLTVEWLTGKGEASELTMLFKSIQTARRYHFE